MDRILARGLEDEVHESETVGRITSEGDLDGLVKRTNPAEQLLVQAPGLLSSDEPPERLAQHVIPGQLGGAIVSGEFEPGIAHRGDGVFRVDRVDKGGLVHEAPPPAAGPAAAGRGSLSSLP